MHGTAAQRSGPLPKEVAVKNVDETNGQLIPRQEASESEPKWAEGEIRFKDSAIASSINGLAMADLEGNLTYVNRSFLKLWGYDSDSDVLGRSVVEFWQAGEQAAAVVGALLEDGGWRGELTASRRDRSTFDAEVSASMVTDEEGEPIGMVASVIDIAERYRAEEALRQSKEKLRLMFDCVADGITVSDLNGVITDLNDGMLEILGLSSKEEAVGRSVFEFVGPGDRARAMASKFPGQVPARGARYTVIRTDGSELPVELSSNVLRDASGKPVGFIGVTRDVTDRRRAEEALQRRAEYFRALIENASDIITVMGGDGTIQYESPSVERVLGYGPEELVGKHVLDFFHPDDRLNVAPDFVSLLQSVQTISSFEFRFRHKDGSWRDLEAVGKSIMGDSGGVAVIVNSRDVTERRRAEQEIKRHTKRVEALASVAQTVSRSLDTQRMLESAVEKVADVMGADTSYVYLLDEVAKTLVLKAHWGLSEQVAAEMSIMKLDEEEFQKGLQWTGRSISLSEVLGETKFGLVEQATIKEDLQSYLVLPFSTKRELYGVIGVASRSQPEFSPDDVDLLQAIADQITVGIENAQLLEKTRALSATDELTGLYNRRRFYEVLEAELSRTRRYGHSFSMVMLDLDGFKQRNDRLGHTNGDNVLKSLAQALKSSLRKTDTAFRYGGDEFAVVLPATEADSAKRIVDRVRSKWLRMPEAQPLVLETPLGFSAGIAEFPKNADTADGLVFLADAALYRSKRQGGHRTTLVSDLGTVSAEMLDRATLDQVYALAATVDARDPHTYGHSKRVAAMSEMIGRAIGSSQEELAALHVASLLHDIGKVGIPDSVLTKPGKPTKDEWESIRKHPAEGAAIVGYVKQLAGAVPMILHHHEWYDGSGYPHGLKGRAIPIGARIISVADAYDTMTTKRTYRDVVSREEALEELRRCSGTQFDPELVEVLCRAADEAIP